MSSQNISKIITMQPDVNRMSRFLCKMCEVSLQLLSASSPSSSPFALQDSEFGLRIGQQLFLEQGGVLEFVRKKLARGDKEIKFGIWVVAEKQGKQYLEAKLAIQLDFENRDWNGFLRLLPGLLAMQKGERKNGTAQISHKISFD